MGSFADTLSFPYQKLVEEPITYSKRGVSKIIASIYDVNGELAPFILRGKVISSLVWSYEKPEKDTEIGSPKSTKSDRLTWDDPLPAHLATIFTEWVHDIKQINEYNSIRYIFGKTNGTFNPPLQENILNCISTVSYTHLTLPTNREV